MLENTEVATEQVAQPDSAVSEGDASQVTAAEGQADQQQQVEPPRTFTQEEVDALVQKRLLKEERRVHRRVESQLRAELAAQAQQTPEPRREAFESNEAYLEALAERKAEEKARALREQEKLEEARSRRREKFETQREQVIDRFPDFDTVVSNPHLPINEAMAEFIEDSELGAELAYALGKDHAKAAQIHRMSPVQAARALMKLEAEIASKPKAQASRAPAPITPVGNRGKAATSSLPSDDDDIDTWMRKEQARMRAR